MVLVVEGGKMEFMDLSFISKYGYEGINISEGGI